MTGTEGPALGMRTSRSGRTTTVSISGELDLATAGELARGLATAVRATPPPERLVLDVAGLDFMDAAGISAVLTAQRALAAGGGVLVLRSPNRLVRRVVKVLELEDVLPVEK